MKRTTFYTTLGGGIGSLLVIGFLIFWATTPPPQKAVPATLLPPTPLMGLEQTSSQEALTSITIKDLTLKELEKSKDLEVIVNAKECRFLQPSDTVECTQITCTLLDHKTPSAQLNTDKALINRTQKTIFFSGTVQGQMKDLVIHGTDINYNFSQQILHTDQTTLYTHPDFHLSAQKSFIDLKNNRIEMSGGVINEFTVHDKQQSP